MNQVTAIDMPVHRFSSQSVKCFTIKAVKRSLSTQNYRPLVQSLSKTYFYLFYNNIFYLLLFLFLTYL